MASTAGRAARVSYTRRVGDRMFVFTRLPPPKTLRQLTSYRDNSAVWDWTVAEFQQTLDFLRRALREMLQSRSAREADRLLERVTFKGAFELIADVLKHLDDSDDRPAGQRRRPRPRTRQ